MTRPNPLAAEEERLLACVHCGFCLPACPTYRQLGDEADSPRGRLHLMRAVAEGRLEPDAPAFLEHIDRCLGCRACETACPSGVEFGHLLERARETSAMTTARDRPTRLFLSIFRQRALTRIVLAMGRVVRGTGLARRLLGVVPERFGRVRFGLAMLAATAPVAARVSAPVHAPAPARESAPAGASAPARTPIPAPTPTRPPTPLRIALPRGCVQDGLFRRVNQATAAVLRANGCTIVELPGESCCGALHAHAGERADARELARANIAAFESSGADLVVINAAGCGAAMKEYGKLLEDDELWAARARAYSARVRDLFEFLAELGPRPGAQLPLRITYDAPCHLHHAQRITRAPLEVLVRVTGVEVVPLPGADECCGGAGIYGILHPELGGRILHEKVAAIRGTGADAVLTPNPGCMMQLGAGLLLEGVEIRVLHPVELLAESYGYT